MKNCRSCGKSVDAHAKVCPSCGAILADDHIANKETAAAEMRQEQSVEKSSRRRFSKKAWVITAILAIILISGTATAIFLHKSPKELYLLSEYKSYQHAKEDWMDRYGDSMEFQEKVSQQPSSTQMTLSGDLDMDSLANDPDFELAKELLSQSSLSANMEQDPKAKKGHYTVALNMNKEKAMDVEMIQTKDQAGLKVPMLYDKYMYLNFDEYGDLMRMVDPLYDGPESLEVSELDWQDLKLSEKEQQHLQRQYGMFLMKNLDNENFKMKKDVEYKHEGESLKGREVTLTLSASETKKLIQALLDEMIDDKELHTMLVKRAQKVASAAAIAEQMDDKRLDTTNMKQQLVDGLKEMKSELKNVRFEKGFTSTLLIDKHEQIIDRKVTTTIGDRAKQVKVDVKSKNVPYGKNQHYKSLSMTLTPQDDQETAVTFQVTNDMTIKKEKRKEDLEASFTVKESGETEKIKFSMNSDIDGEDREKQDINRTFTLAFDGGDFSDMPSMWKGTIKQQNDLNLKDDYSHSKIKATIGLGDAQGSGNITVNLDTKTKLKDKADLPEFTLEDEGINIVSMKPEEMYAIQQEVGTNLMELGMKYGLIPEDMYEYGINETSYDGFYDLEEEDTEDAM